MRSTERRLHGRPLRRRAAVAIATALFASLLWLVVPPAAPAQGAIAAKLAANPPRGAMSAAAPAHDSGHSRAHKEGTVAVVVSVIGVIAVVVLVVGLGSLSVRRRTRSAPPARGPTQGGPPGRGRGLFG
jgi:hypothetical protein